MYRRGFLRSIGSVAAIPCVGIPKVPPKDWRCIIGGNRAGKSTKAAKLVGGFQKIEVMSKDMSCGHRLCQALLPSRKLSDVRLTSNGWDYDFTDRIKAIKTLNEGYSWALWIDETSLDGIEEIAGLYDRVVFTSWPSIDGILGTPFYEECLRMGTVERLPMLPHLRAKYPEFEQGLSPLEFAARIEGRFV